MFATTRTGGAFFAALLAATAAGCTGTGRTVPGAAFYAGPAATGGLSPSPAGTSSSGSSGGGSSSSSSSGGTSSGGGVADRVAPVIANAAVAPAAMRFTGGTATITADVTDSGGVRRVWAEVTRPDGSTSETSLSAIGFPSYAGTWAVPLDPTAGTTVTYAFRVRAEDWAGNTAEAVPVTLTVQLPIGPPGNPSL